MHILESQDLNNLPVAQWGFPLAHFPRNLHIGTRFLQKLFRGDFGSDGRVRGVEHLHLVSMTSRKW